MKKYVELRYEQPSLTPEMSWRKLFSARCEYAVAKGQNDHSEMKKYALKIRRYQKELGKKVDDFPELGITGYS